MRLIAGLAFLLTGAQAAFPAHTKARVFLSHEMAKPGNVVWAAIELRMDPGWHTYWRNAGDSGKATTINWQLPTNITAGTIHWPVPEKLTAAGLTTYVYHNEATLLIPLTVDATSTAGRVELNAAIRWLECSRDVCLQGRSSWNGTLIVGTDSKPSADAPRIEQARQKLPQKKPDGFVAANWETPANGKRPLVIEWVPQAAGATGDFFPFEADTISAAAATENIAGVAGKMRLRKVVELLQADWPKTFGGLFLEKAGEMTRAVFEAQFAVGEAPTVAAAAAPAAAVPAQPPAADSNEKSSTASTPTEASSPPSADPAPAKGGLLTNLLFAFLGGLILNLMPCVLPVIALKIFGFVNQARESPARVRLLGLVYGAGVVVSFLFFAVLVIAGKYASWGVQFGDSRFLIAMTVLVSCIALNFFGVFEVTLGGRAMEAASEAAGKKGATGSFFNGVLATVLGTSCSAPFLAGAIGYAYFQPPWIILLIFAFLGFGLAAPYVVLSFQPAWLRYLPKPGPWMERFKIAMGFPMLATAAWMLSLIGRHYGTRGVLWIGVFLVVLALSLWIFGEFYQRGRSQRTIGLATSVVVLLMGYAGILEQQLHWRTKPVPPTEGAVAASDPNDLDWKPWSPEAVKAGREAGKVVFVDFTADWCFNCQVNKKTSIDILSVHQKLKDLGAVMLLADYTLTPDNITEELARFQRNSVPLVLVYPKDATKPPIVLPPLLTKQIVLEALDKASQ